MRCLNSHDRISRPSEPELSVKLVNSAANGGFLQSHAVHMLCLNLLCHRIHEFVILPERGMLPSKLDSLLHEGMTVGVLVFAGVCANETLILTVSQHLPVQSVDHDVHVVVSKLPGFVTD